MSMLGELLRKIDRNINRNEYDISYLPAEKNHVNIEHSLLNNVGDHLGPVIVDWLLEQKRIDRERIVKKTKHLMTVGSIIGRGRFDCTIWGSGILKYSHKDRMVKLRKIYRRKMDIRAVRGPETRDILVSVGYDCPEIYGDPAVLMPLIYSPGNPEKEYEVSVILHHRTERTADHATDDKNFLISISNDFIEKNHLHFIDPKTGDYKFFIDELVKSKRVVSSSLHGIILAEAYGVPAVFMNWGMDDQPIKFQDWYLSTGRKMTYAKTIEEGVLREPMPLPDLSKMREALLNSFPYDLWEE